MPDLRSEVVSMPSGSVVSIPWSVWLMPQQARQLGWVAAWIDWFSAGSWLSAHPWRHHRMEASPHLLRLIELPKRQKLYDLTILSCIWQNQSRWHCFNTFIFALILSYLSVSLCCFVCFFYYCNGPCVSKSIYIWRLKARVTRPRTRWSLSVCRNLKMHEFLLSPSKTVMGN